MIERRINDPLLIGRAIDIGRPEKTILGKLGLQFLHRRCAVARKSQNIIAAMQ